MRQISKYRKIIVRKNKFCKKGVNFAEIVGLDSKINQPAKPRFTIVLWQALIAEKIVNVKDN